MLYHLLYPLAENYPFLSFLNIFRYITFRAIIAAVLAIIFVIIFGRYFIAFMMNKASVLRCFTPSTHQKKKGTPSMGGLVILVSLTLSVFIAGDWNNAYVCLALVNFWLFAAIGFADDYVKVRGADGKRIVISPQDFFIDFGVCYSLFFIFFYKGRFCFLCGRFANIEFTTRNHSVF